MRPFSFNLLPAGSRYRTFALALEIILVGASVLFVLFFSYVGVKRWFGLDVAIVVSQSMNLLFFWIIVRAYSEAIQELRRPGAERQPTRED